MRKLYLRKDGRITDYHEAWVNGDSVIEHWGRLGQKGSTREHDLDDRQTAEENVLRVLATARARGYAPIDLDEHAVCLIEYAVSGMGSSADVDKRHALEDRLNEKLGWTGLGVCDGGSIGSGTMEVCCFVVDYALAHEIIARDLAGTEFADYTRIYEEERD